MPNLPCNDPPQLTECEDLGTATYEFTPAQVAEQRALLPVMSRVQARVIMQEDEED